MGICPLCNGLERYSIICQQCSQTMSDQGKVIDYFDDYSAYLDTDGMKKADGYAHDIEQHQCPHIFYCEHCHNEIVYLIEENFLSEG